MGLAPADATTTQTPGNLTPEQLEQREVGPAADLHALGTVLHEMLTGKKPFTGRDPMTVLFNQCEAPLPVLPRQLSHHQALLDRLLAKKPQERIQSAAEVLEWL